MNKWEACVQRERERVGTLRLQQGEQGAVKVGR